MKLLGAENEFPNGHSHNVVHVLIRTIYNYSSLDTTITGYPAVGVRATNAIPTRVSKQDRIGSAAELQLTRHSG